MSFDQNNCPACLHRFVLSVGKSLVEIKVHNEDIRSKHEKTMTIWNSLPSMRRGAKPKIRPIHSQHLAWMCTKMHCINRIKGVGCVKCIGACLNAVKAGWDTAPTMTLILILLSVRAQFVHALVMIYSIGTRLRTWQVRLGMRERGQEEYSVAELDEKVLWFYWFYSK